jgi:hypothetical protein
MAYTGIPLSEWSGSGATKDLEQTVRRLAEQSARQSRQMLYLTWAIAVLTLVMTVGVAVQIFLATR